jgi:hypothetical protein
LVNGLPIVAKIKKFPCTVVRQTWEPCDEDQELWLHQIIVYFLGEHNHPAFPDHNLSLADLHAVKKVYGAVGNGAITAGALNIGK